MDMLIDFKVENFLSFTNRTSFSMIPSEDECHLKQIYNINDLSLLRFGAIFGANSSGKSNFLKAIAFAKEVILDNTKLIKGKNRFSKTIKGNDQKETMFEFTLYINNKVYTYGFSTILIDNKFNEEWIYMHEIEKDVEIPILERNVNEDKFNFYFDNLGVNDEIELIKMANYQNDFGSNSKVLFLSEMNKNKNIIVSTSLSIFNDIYNWINNKLRIISFTNEVYIHQDFNQSFYQRLLTQFDVGIKELILNEISENEFKARVGQSCYENISTLDSSNILIKGNDYLLNVKKEDDTLVFNNVLLKHDKSDYLFEFIDESEGSKRLFDYLSLLTNKDEECVYVIDEINKSLHPLLIKKFILLFNKYKIDSQLIFSSHDPNLLDILRSDEIWLVERQNDDSSRMYSLDKFNVNKTRINIDYLKGKFGGIPYLKEGIDDND